MHAPHTIDQFEHAAGNEIVGHINHEERIAIGASMYGVRQCSELFAFRRHRKTFRQVIADGVDGQEAERYLFAQPPAVELLLERAKRMRAHDYIRRTIRTEDQEPRRLPPPREHTEKIQSGMVAPMQIF